MVSTAFLVFSVVRDYVWTRRPSHLDDA